MKTIYIYFSVMLIDRAKNIHASANIYQVDKLVR
jgi:hypothetical protein